MKELVIAEGTVEVKETNFYCILEAKDGICKHHTPILTGWLKSKGGATNISFIEETLKHLNGRQVKIVFFLEDK